jgi:TM2 domain-containing membrane protein YozV
MPSYQNPANPQAAAPNPYFQTPPNPQGVSTSPGLAFALGWIPGVGAIYNGQYVKGLVHAVIFGLLISLMNSVDNSAGEPLLAMMLVGFIFYMAFEAYHTARKRQMGIQVEEWSSLMANGRAGSRAPIGPILLILLGVLFLLDTLRVIEFRELARFWPVLLILVGAFMLYNRVTSPLRDPRTTRPLDPSAANDASAASAMDSRHE